MNSSSNMAAHNCGFTPAGHRIYLFSSCNSDRAFVLWPCTKKLRPRPSSGTSIPGRRKALHVVGKRQNRIVTKRMFDEDFCIQLEYSISDALTKSADIDWRRCWCDGILLPDNEKDFESTQIYNTRVLFIKAWIDEGREETKERGQFLYDMRIEFGEMSINALRIGGNLEDCIPTTGADSWILLERKNKNIYIQLL